MVKWWMTLVVFVSFLVQGQQNGSIFIMLPESIPVNYRVPGTLGASATFTPGIMLNQDRTNFYLSGFAEYHLDRKISWRSDNYFYLNSPSAEFSDVTPLFRSYFGAFYHLNSSVSGNWDVKIGFQPGISVLEKNNNLPAIDASSRALMPSFAVSIGFDYYVWKYFHFFSHLSYANATMRGASNGSIKTDELLFSLGLGFQI